MTAEIPDRLLQSITHVVHAAACTSFRSVREVERTNVVGTRRLAVLFQRARRLQRFLYVGTAYKCGAASSKVVGEDDREAVEHVVPYTRTKADAEKALESLDLPVLVARPSVIVGHSTLGVRPSASLYWYYRALAEAGISPFPDTKRRDVVPVDWVADAIASLLFNSGPRHRRYHLSAGEGAASTWGEIRGALVGPSAVSEVIAADSIAAHPVWARIAPGDARLRMGLEACSRFSGLPIEWFANDRLLEAGVPPPPKFAAYLARCVESSTGSIAEQMRDDE